MFNVDPDKVSVTVANTPFGIVVELKPKSTHVDVPLPLLQITDLPAAVEVGLAATLNAEMSVGE